jgi:hypothetical protein
LECPIIDDDDLLNTTGNAQLGELKIVTTQIKVIEPSAPDAPETIVSLSDGTMHERSKKAGVHNVQYAIDSCDISQCFDDV